MVSRPETTKQQQQQHHDWHVIERKASSFCCLLIRVALFFPCCPTLVGSLVESAIRLTWDLMAQLILAGSQVMGKGKWASPLVCRFRCALLYIGRGLLLMTRPVLYKSTSSGAFKWRSPWLLERRPSSIRRCEYTSRAVKQSMLDDDGGEEAWIGRDFHQCPAITIFKSGARVATYRKVSTTCTKTSLFLH